MLSFELPACVAVANHPSDLDGIAMAAALPGRYTFVAAEVFTSKPLNGFFLRRIGVRFVERTDPEQGVSDVQRLADAARGGERLVLFPEACLAPVAACARSAWARS
jgi:1-acyl-sn-glycerol-3-phosphate acyltransferase